MTEADVVPVPAAPAPARRLRVLTVIDGLRLAGAENLLIGLAGACGPAGIDLSVTSLLDHTSTESVADDLQAAGVPVHSLGADRLLDVAALRRLTRLIRRSGIDIVHAHLQYAVTLAPLAARAARRPVVCSFHHLPGEVELRDRVKERLAVASANRSDGVIVVSAAQLRAFGERYTLREGRWQVVHNGIALEAFISAAGSQLPEDLRERTRDRPVVALVARRRPGKGHEHAVEAWPRVLEQVPGAHLLLVGDGPLGDALHARAVGLGIEDHVTLTGPRRDIPAIVAGADLVVLPSDTEALPTTLIEAAAAATPVVATDVGGVPEVVSDGRTGLLVPRHDGAAFAGAVARLLLDEPLRSRMGRDAQALAVERFDARRWAERLATTYRAAVEEHGQGAA